MCGRYQLTTSMRRLGLSFGFDEFSEIRITPRFNIAPSQRVPIVRNEVGAELEIIRRAEGGTTREAVMARWGLIPAWAKNAAIGYKTINARAEGLAGKPAFRDAFKRRRCIVPASGFYEWKRPAKGAKQPHLIRRTDGELIGFAGLWETWTDRETGQLVTSCTIVTCEPNELMSQLHNRMPVILAPADYDAWLDPSDLRGPELLRPCPTEWLEALPVSTRVNSPKNDDPSIFEPDNAALEDRLL